MMIIGEEAKRAADDLMVYIVSFLPNCDSTIRSRNARIVQQAIDEAVAADRETHKAKISDLATINARQQKEIERLRGHIEIEIEDLKAILSLGYDANVSCMIRRHEQALAGEEE